MATESELSFAKSSRTRRSPVQSVKQTFSCQKCKNHDNASMVQCDKCDQWYHFDCVGVDSSVSQRDWCCEVCSGQCYGKPLEVNVVIAAPNKSTPIVTRLQEHQAKAKSLTIASAKGDKSKKSKSSSSTRRNLELMKVEEEREMQKKRDETYLKKKYEILAKECSSDESDSASSISNKTERVDQWVENASAQLINGESEHVVDLKVKSAARVSPNGQSQVNMPDLNLQSTVTLPLNQPNILTTAHMSARHVMPRDLPLFSGNPTEWPIFISSFNSTTELCGYSNEENLIRLQRCLKGRALEAVRCRLMLPNSITIIIDTLKMLFGRPEIIINTLLLKIRSEPPPRADKFETLVTFALSIQNLCATIEASGLLDHLNNPCLVQELVEKLPSNLKLTWAMHKITLPSTNLATLSSWLYTIAQAASQITIPYAPIKDDPTCRSRREFFNTHEQKINYNTNKKCCICNSGCQKVAQCVEFKKLDLNKRWQLISKYKLCRKCLGHHHQNRCNTTEKCGEQNCQFRHHPLLHKYIETSTTENCNAHKNTKQKTFFRILPVTLYSQNKSINTFAFFDEGSSLTMIDEGIANELNLNGTPDPLCLRWTGNTVRMEQTSRRVELKISGQNVNNKLYSLKNLRTVKSLDLPSQSISTDILKSKYPYLRDVEIQEYNNAVPRILIGLDNSQLTVPLKTVEGKENEPIATKSRLGWTVHGCVRGIKDDNYESVLGFQNYHVCECQRDDVLHDLVKEFFAMENNCHVVNRSILASKDDKRANEILLKTTTKIEGRYETGLLWRYDQFNLPDSYSMALRRLVCIEKKMKNDPNLSKQLNEHLNDYIEKGYIRQLNNVEINKSTYKTWYLPLFTVQNPNKPNKFRMVWDAAAKVNGVSLNMMLLAGPDQLVSLVGVLLRFRLRKIGLCGDIKEMFHQVNICEEDQQAQRFLWRWGDERVKPEVYVMQVMTFGATCSPCSAQFVKNSNAKLFENQYPRAVESIIQNHYVDDLLDSVDTVAEAVQLIKQLKFIHKNAGFEIHKFITNSNDVIDQLNLQEATNKNLNIDPESSSEKVLGMWWNPTTDMFTYKVNRRNVNEEILTGERKPTKRQILRILMSVYDPLGLLSNFIIQMKIILQHIWQSKIGWDDEIIDEHYHQWKIWLDLLPSINNIQIPRWYNLGLRENVQLHVFVDASKSAYAAVAYFRSTNEHGHIKCSLVAAKTRVAPLKVMSIPRLELQAAVLGTRLADKIAEEHKIIISKKIFWTDSTTVLSWIQSSERKYRQFVAFRISEVLDSTKEKDWHWVPTDLNVADDATKWVKPPTFDSNNRWYNGPEFLLRPEDSWPEKKTLKLDSNEEVLNIHFNTKKNVTPFIMFEKFSKYQRLLRTTAFCLRFIHNMRVANKLNKLNGSLDQCELQKAEDIIIRTVQQECFGEEIDYLVAEQNVPAEKKKGIDKRSNIYNKSPYLDENNILRSYGRIDMAPLIGHQTKRPIILPKNHHITNLIVKNFHEKFHHCNHETVINEIRQKYAVINLRAVVKKVRYTCQWCKNENAKPAPPFMGDLPTCRLAAFTRPFTFTGVDYFGPIMVAVGRRSEKRWGVLFTCMTIRAVHIEIAHSLSTDSCIMVIQNFIARRGIPSQMFSDNGTNFKGANNELKAELKKLNYYYIKEKITSTAPTIEWNFNPPASPHMGGSWERLIRTTKNNLYRVLPARKPTDELLRCLVIGVEHIINSRPLTFVSLETVDDEALTPNHFLLGSSSGVKPLGKFNENILITRHHWKKLEYLLDTFWRRWVKEYLPIITRRTKWFEKVKPIEAGDIVIIVDDQNQRNEWPKGMVLETFAGKDGQVRSASVKTPTGIYTRPAVKLAVLDVNSQ